MKILLLLLFLHQVSTLPDLPAHSFEKRVFYSKNAICDSLDGDQPEMCKKVFVTFTQGPYVFKKRREKGVRVTFTCNSCQKVNHYLPVVAVRDRLDSDPEHDVYTLDGDTLPSSSDHLCGSSGIEDMVRKFRKEIEEEIRKDPTQPFPSLYLEVRSKYTRKLPLDAKNLFLSEIPPYDTLQTGMYRIRRDYVPATPSTQAELNCKSSWFLLDSASQESVLKGDIIHSDGLRVLLFASDESLRVLARTRTILADGTFRITPHLWYQTFILSAEFRENQFIPVAFGLLPDKKRRSYDDFFTLLKQALEHPSRDLSLSAEWIMSDFEHNIRASWQEIFPEVQAKGCHFHYAKAIWSIVKKRNRAPDYSNVEEFPKFGSFVRAVIGLPYVPLERMEEGMRVLEKLSKANTGPRKKFCKDMIEYLRNTWLDGSIPREVWNMFNHRGVATNNHAEAFNSKMGAKKQIGKHPNPYTLIDEIKTQLSQAADTVVAETVNVKKKRTNKNQNILKDARKALMKDLSKRNVDLETYMIQIGAKTLKYEPKVMSDPDPDPLGLGEKNCLSDDQAEESGSDLEDDDQTVDITLDLNSGTVSPPPPPPRQPTSACQPTLAPARRKGPGKARRKKQLPIPNSEVSFVHVESQPDSEERFVASVGGQDLREIRRNQENEDSQSDMFASALSAAAIASAGLTVLSRFTSRSSARRSSIGRRSSGSSVPCSPRASMSVLPRTSSSSLPRATIPATSVPSSATSDLVSEAKCRVKSLGFRFSSTQPSTKRDGNCMVHAILDQLKKCGHPILRRISNIHDLRLFICSKLQSQLDENVLFWVSNISPKLWLKKMKVDGTWCDDVFLQIAANILNKNVILIPLSPSSAHHGGMYSDLRSVHGGSGDPIFLLYFEEWITTGHYQSLEIDPNVDMNRVLGHFHWRTRCLSRSVLGSSSGPPATSASGPPATSASGPPATSARASPAHLPTEPLHSTRQRMESEAGITFGESPISRPRASVENSQDVTLPPSISCSASNCTHVVVYGTHFEPCDWEVWTSANDTITGTCEFCGLVVGPTRGIPREQRLQHHILRKCKKYCHKPTKPPAPVVTPPTHPPATLPRPQLPSGSSAPSSAPESEASSSTQRMCRPKPLVCKKKKGTCDHVVAFGNHYNKHAWKVYEDYLSTQHAITPLPEEV